MELDTSRFLQATVLSYLRIGLDIEHEDDSLVINLQGTIWIEGFDLSLTECEKLADLLLLASRMRVPHSVPNFVRKSG